MKQVIANENNKEDVLEYVDSKVYLTVNTQETMTDWFKRCLRVAFPNILFGVKMEIPIDIMMKVTNVYLYTR